MHFQISINKYIQGPWEENYKLQGFPNIVLFLKLFFLCPERSHTQTHICLYVHKYTFTDNPHIPKTSPPTTHPYIYANWQKNRYTDQWNNKESRTNPYIYGQSIYDKGPKIYNGERAASSINGARKTGQPHAKEWNWTTVL